MSNAVTLSSLAMLKVTIDSGKDYLEYLRPYVLQVLAESPPEVVTDESVAQKIRTICGLVIPRRTVQVVLQRISREGYLRRENGVYTVTKDLPVTDTTAIRVAAARNIDSISSALVAFAKQSAQREITSADAVDCLITFLSQFSIPCLKSYLRGTTLPVADNQSDWQVLLVSQFVAEISSQPNLLDSFVQIVQGHMLANALLCPDLHSVANSYRDVTFYFDTPLLIQFLGLEGPQEEQAIKEMIGLVQSLGGKVAYFSHTLDELLNAITISADYIASPKGRGTIVNEARKSGRSKSDLILVAEHAEEDLEKSGIVVARTPPYDERTHKFEISENVFGSVLSEEINYHNPRARDFDIKSVRSIYVLRQGIKPNSIEKSRAVLVTNNASFSKAAYEYGVQYEQSREVSPVITDFSLANTAWLKAPQGAPSLPRKEVMAFAYAALRPSTEFWSKVLAEADKLEAQGKITPRDHQLLRSSHHVQSELMKLTLGEDSALSEESITKTLERVSNDIRREESDKLQQSESARHHVERQLAARTAENDGIKKRIYWRCDRRATIEAKCLSIAIWLGQASVAIFGAFKIPDNSTFGWLVVAAAVVSGVLRLAGTHWDIKPLKAAPAYKQWRLNHLLRREYQALAIEASET